MIFLTGAETQLAEVLSALGRFIGKVDAILAAFEPEGTAAAEDLEARLEAVRGRLEGFARRVAEDSTQYTLELIIPTFRRPTWSRWVTGWRRTPRTLPCPTISPTPS